MAKPEELLDILAECIWNRDRALKAIRKWIKDVLEKAHPEIAQLREEVELNRRMVAHYYIPSHTQISHVEDHKEQVYRCGSCPREDWELFYGMAYEEYKTIAP